MNTDLIELVREDIHTFLKSNQELFFNERDFQMHLALWLKSLNKYDDVDLEYYVPRAALHVTEEECKWNSELRIDIIVRKGDAYLPVELKYKTKRVDKKTLLRFGEDIQATEGKSFEIMKSQGAQDLGMYDFWKDVRRIELVRNRFENVVGGLAVFLTNDKAYQHTANVNSNNYLLSISEGVHSREKHWKDEYSACAKRHRNFEVECEYAIEWHSAQAEDVNLHYCIVTVEDKEPLKQQSRSTSKQK